LPGDDRDDIRKEDAETVSVIDSKTLTVVAKLPCPGRPIRVKITPDGQSALVLCAELGLGGLVVFDAATRRVTRNANTGPAISLAVDPAGHHVYVARVDLDQVAVLDLRKWDYSDPIKTGHGPDGLVIAVPR
jgi:DNA-binding beta-propeller fold protein YncE